MSNVCFVFECRILLPQLSLQSSAIMVYQQVWLSLSFEYCAAWLFAVTDTFRALLSSSLLWVVVGT